MLLLTYPPPQPGDSWALDNNWLVYKFVPRPVPSDWTLSGSAQIPANLPTVVGEKTFTSTASKAQVYGDWPKYVFDPATVKQKLEARQTALRIEIQFGTFTPLSGTRLGSPVPHMFFSVFNFFS